MRLLGEDLVLFRDRSGKLGLDRRVLPAPPRVARLRHSGDRRDPLPLSRLEVRRQRRVHRSAERTRRAARSKTKVACAGYPVASAGRDDLRVSRAAAGAAAAALGRLRQSEGAIRTIGWTHVPCNWLQIMENSLDPVHTEWLHGQLQEFVEEKQRGAKYQISRKHLKIDVRGVRATASTSAACSPARPRTPTTGRSATRSSSRTSSRSAAAAAKLWKMHTYQMRVPIDDEHSMHYWYIGLRRARRASTCRRKLRERIPLYEVRYRDEHGEYILDNIDAQDIMAWVTQGPDRAAPNSRSWARPTAASSCSARCSARDGEGRSAARIR